MRSRTTRAFRTEFDAPPADTQVRATRVYQLWRVNPDHPSLRFKCVDERRDVHSVRIGLRWRALGYREDIDGEVTFTWFWIGSHADYDRLIAAL